MGPSQAGTAGGTRGDILSKNPEVNTGVKAKSLKERLDKIFKIHNFFPIKVFEEYLPMVCDKGDKEGGERRGCSHTYFLL